MHATTIGLDLAKHGADREGRAVLRKRLRRGEVEAFFRALPPCLVGMGACGTAHHWASGARPTRPTPRRSARQ